jgi:hypothetical protein
VRGEDIIQAGIVRYLNAALPADCIHFAVPNGAVLAGDKAMRGRQVNKLKSTGMVNGAPDIIVVARGITIGLEVKTPKGPLADTQKLFGDRLTAAGGRYHVVRSIDDVEQVLAGEGVPLRARTLRFAA